MTGIKLARLIMTVVLMGSSILSFILDWSPNHLLNPLWHPHARFHGALLLFLLAGVSVMGTWLLWRRSREPGVAIVAAIVIAVSYWTPLFFIPFVLPSSSWWAGTPGHEPRIGGMAFYPNLAVAAVFLLLTAVAGWFARKAGNETTQEAAR
jgi:hypothetical protein